MSCDEVVRARGRKDRTAEQKLLKQQLDQRRRGPQRLTQAQLASVFSLAHRWSAVLRGFRLESIGRQSCAYAAFLRSFPHVGRYRVLSGAPWAGPQGSGGGLGQSQACGR